MRLFINSSLIRFLPRGRAVVPSSVLTLGVFLLLLFGCSLEQEEPIDPTFEHEPVGDSLKEIRSWMCVNIQYESEEEDNWRMPEETYQRGGGDCEDLAILLMYFLWENGEGSELVLVESDEVKKGTHHALVRYNGELLEGYGFEAERDRYGDVQETYTFQEALRECKEI
ncbi:hypothetical protein GF348_09315 [candidate division KSB3 bacterium]|nr:hypothetical protein [candidate division KSB3 bacterium]